MPQHKHIDLVAALENQKRQLQQLLDRKIWISEAPERTLEEMSAQTAQLKSLIQELDDVIQKGKG